MSASFKTTNTLRTISRTLPRTLPRSTTQHFSVLARARQLARLVEPHPFERMSFTQQSQAPDYGKLVKRIGDAAVIYFPFMALFLTWPIVTEKLLDGNL